MAAFQPDLGSADFYEVLGINRNASDVDINKAYKKLALQFHPDKNQENKEQAENDFKRVSEAYHALCDDEKRKIYDQRGKAEVQGRASCGGSAPGMSHQQSEALFRSLFGGGGLDPFAYMPSNKVRTGPKSGFAGSQFGIGRESGDINIDIGGIFAGLGGKKSSKRKEVLRPLPAYAMPASTSVVIRDLANAQHIGKTGIVKGFDESRCRYQVAVEGGGEAIWVKPRSLTQQCSIEVVGLESKPELNGKLGDVFNYRAEDGRYMVLLAHPQLAISLHRSNCLLRQGTPVVLDGLTNEKFNGQMAQIVSIDRVNARYVVRCQDGEQIKVKYDKVVC